MQENFDINTPDGVFTARLARTSFTPAPVVIVIQEIFGVNASIRKIADDLACQGFLAVCPDLFWRFEPGLQLSDHNEADCKKAFGLYDRYNFNDGIKDIAATIAACRTLPGCTGKVGVMGFCLGGLLSFLAATRTDVDVAAGYYGAETERFLTEAPNIRKPLLLHLAGEDEFMDKAAQEEIGTVLSGNSLVEIHTYHGCGHAFARPNGDHYDAAAAASANRRTLDFLASHLGRRGL